MTHLQRVARILRPQALVILSALVAACGGGGGPGQPPPANVSVSEVVVRNITEWDEFTGRIAAVDDVEIRPRVQGYLREVHFEDGQIVEAGDTLFTIDQREYRAAVALARADLDQAEARYALAESELARGEALREARALSTEELARREGEHRQARAALGSARAALERAELDLEFTVLKAPMRGRIGEALVDVGNLISPGTTLLATLVAIDPVHVIFEGDERIYLKYQAQAQTGDRPSSREAPNPVQVGLADDTGFPFRGTMDFVDNRINPETGTIQGRALLDNADGYLIPGLFARVRLLGRSDFEALLIHDVAVLTDQDRKYVYVLGEDNTVLRRDVTLGREVEGLRVVDAGLEPGDKVVVNGVRKIFFNGAPVVPTDVPMDDPLRATAPAGPAPAAAASED
ncbi:MAG: efflux RND transporter periplasmic adaptor subunit [Pseudomonadota bacterium]